MIAGNRREVGTITSRAIDLPHHNCSINWACTSTDGNGAASRGGAAGDDVPDAVTLHGTGALRFVDLIGSLGRIFGVGEGTGGDGNGGGAIVIGWGGRPRTRPMGPCCFW